jgi:hypothetical protein
MSWSLGFQPTLRSANRACRATCYVVAYALVRKVKSPALVIGVRWGELGCTNKAGKEPLSHLAMSRNLVLPLFLCGMVSHLRQEDRFRGSSGIAVVATTPDRSRDCQRPRLIARCSSTKLALWQRADERLESVPLPRRAPPPRDGQFLRSMSIGILCAKPQLGVMASQLDAVYHAG